MGILPALGVAVAATINGDVNLETDLFLTAALAFGQAKNLPLLGNRNRRCVQRSTGSTGGCCLDKLIEDGPA